MNFLPAFKIEIRNFKFEKKRLWLGIIKIALVRNALLLSVVTCELEQFLCSTVDVRNTFPRFFRNLSTFPLASGRMRVTFLYSIPSSPRSFFNFFLLNGGPLSVRTVLSKSNRANSD